MFSFWKKRIPYLNRVDVVSIREISNGNWLGSTSSTTKGKTLLLGNENNDSFHVKGLDYLLMALGASSGDQVKYLVEQHGKKIDKMSTFISEQMGEINIKYEVDSKFDTKNDIARISDIVNDNLCPVANTLTTKTRINMSGKLI